MMFTCNVCNTKIYDGSAAICHQDECIRPTSIDEWCDGLIGQLDAIPTIPEATNRVIAVLVRGHANTLKHQFE
jgi:hypothetical protein